MPMYLTAFSYTPETWARFVQNPEDRREPVRTLVEARGGKLHGFWYAFGEFDGFVLFEAPENVSAVSFLAPVAGSSAFTKLQTTVLLSVEEMLDSVKQAQSVSYRPPGG